MPEGEVAGATVQRVVLVDRISRRRAGPYHATTLPGHLVQLTLAGRARHEAGGRTFVAGPGTVAWFYEDEEVRIEVAEAPWTFYTANFVAPGLPPPPYDLRVRRGTAETERRFGALLRAWRDRSAGPLVRHLRVEARLLDLLADVLPAEAAPFRLDPAARVWWELEEQVRARMGEPVRLEDLCRWSGRSARTLYRACRSATGLAPLKRVKRIRLSLARGLVLYSPLSVSEIAYRVGYPRVQELCRDYRRFVGLTPLEDRAAGPDYRRRRARFEV